MPSTTTKAARGRPKSIDRDAVIGRAVAHFWRVGLRAVSLNQLCLQLQISKPGLYREFGSEDGLMDAALARYHELAVVPLIGLFASELSFADTLDRAVDALTDIAQRPAGCLFTRMRLDRPRLGEQTLTRLDTIESQRLAAFEARFVRARLDGDGAELTPEDAARFLDAQLTLVLTRMATGEDASLVARDARLALGALIGRER